MPPPRLSAAGLILNSQLSRSHRPPSKCSLSSSFLFCCSFPEKQRNVATCLPRPPSPRPLDLPSTQAEGHPRQQEHLDSGHHSWLGPQELPQSAGKTQRQHLLLPYLLHIAQPFGVQQHQSVSRLAGVRYTPHPDTFGVGLHAAAQGETCGEDARTSSVLNTEQQNPGTLVIQGRDLPHLFSDEPACSSGRTCHCGKAPRWPPPPRVG